MEKIKNSMSEIEKIYNVFETDKSRVKIREWDRNFDNLTEKLCLNPFDDEKLTLLVQYIDNIEKNSFTNGFKQAVKLMTECFTAE